MRFKSRSRALIGSALAASLGLAGLALSASPAMASEPTDVVRVAGTTRYGTAADAATSAYPAGAANVVLASGEKFPDALAGGGLAGSLDAPILLSQQNALPAETAAALAELDADTVTILGGTSAISAAVETALETAGYTVDRVGGADRFETAALIAEELGGTTAVLANGLRFPDALAISPGAHALELPLLLTTVDGLHEDAAAYIDANAVESVIIVGGTAVVSQATEDALEADGITVTRLAGADRYASSVEIAEFHVTQGFTLAEVVMATGEKFPDALAGGPYASQMNAPMVLTQTATLTPVTAAFLTSNCQAIDALSILGGTAAITTAVETAAAAAAQCDTNQSFGVSPAGPQQNTTSTSAVTNEGAETFTFSSVDGPVKVELLPCANVTNTNGDIVLADADGTANEADGLGDTSTGAAVIEQVNGVAYLDNTAVAPVNGNITVVVDSEDFDCAVVVIYQDADGDNQIDLDANNRPTEDFALGGPVLFLPPEAPNGTYANGFVQYIDEVNDFFILSDGFLYNYDANDQYSYYSSDAGDSFFVTAAAFENYVNVGDYVESTDVTGYSQDAAVANEFELSTDETLAPTGLAVTVGDFDALAETTSDDARFTWTAATEGLVDYYTVYVYDDDPAVAGCQTAVPTTNVDTATNATTVDVEELADDTYCAVVTATSVTGDESAASAPVFFATGAPADTVRPTITDARVTTDALLQDRVDAGDVFRLTFSEDMADDVDATGVFVITDVDGDTYTLDCSNAASATCALTDDGLNVDRILTITVVAAADTNAAGDGILEIPGTITTTDADVRDQGNNVVNLATSADVLIDKEA